MPTSISAAQRRVLDAAVEAFSEQGFGGTSTRDIAARAGRSPAAVYIHYESKEDLLYAVSLRGHEDSLDVLRSAYAAHSEPHQRLWEMVFAFSHWHMEHAKLGRVVQYELRALSESHRAEVIGLRRTFHQVMVEAITAGIDAALFDVPDLHGTARALLSLGIDLARWFDPDLQRDADGVARTNADLAVRMVGSHTPTDAPRTSTAPVPTEGASL